MDHTGLQEMLENFLARDEETRPGRVAICEELLVELMQAHDTDCLIMAMANLMRNYFKRARTEEERRLFSDTIDGMNGCAETLRNYANDSVRQTISTAQSLDTPIGRLILMQRERQ